MHTIKLFKKKKILLLCNTKRKISSKLLAEKERNVDKKGPFKHNCHAFLMRMIKVDFAEGFREVFRIPLISSLIFSSIRHVFWTLNSRR